MPNKFLENVKSALENLVTLKIETVITESGGSEKMSSEIDLIDGDITNTIPKSFLAADMKEIRTFHESQVEKGQQIIRDNLAALRELYDLIKHGGSDLEVADGAAEAAAKPGSQDAAEEP